MSIYLMINYARSGGTLINQCLACLPKVIILSEVNPLGGGSGLEAYTTVKQQARNWFNIPVQSDNFAEAVMEVYDYCQKNDITLIVRDWSFVNFTPYPLNSFNPPNKFLTYEALKDKVNIIPFSFVRDSIDVWISRGMPKNFFEAYSRFINGMHNFNGPVFKYEDLCLHPENEIKKICNFLNIPYNEGWRKYSDFKKVNGDIQVSIASRGGREAKIRLMPRKLISPLNMLWINTNREMKKANSALNYPTSYFNGNVEPLGAFFYKKLKNRRKH
jgi:hypothetical protein